MAYPTMEEVEHAGRYTLARWNRFLPSPGQAAIGKSNFDEICGVEAKIMNRILERFREAGGMTPEISKSLGW